MPPIFVIAQTSMVWCRADFQHSNLNRDQASAACPTLQDWPAAPRS